MTQRERGQNLALFLFKPPLRCSRPTEIGGTRERSSAALRSAVVVAMVAAIDWEAPEGVVESVDAPSESVPSLAVALRVAPSIATKPDVRVAPSTPDGTLLPAGLFGIVGTELVVVPWPRRRYRRCYHRTRDGCDGYRRYQYAEEHDCSRSIGCD